MLKKLVVLEAFTPVGESDLEGAEEGMAVPPIPNLSAPAVASSKKSPMISTKRPADCSNFTLSVAVTPTVNLLFSKKGDTSPEIVIPKASNCSLAESMANLIFSTSVAFVADVFVVSVRNLRASPEDTEQSVPSKSPIMLEVKLVKASSIFSVNGSVIFSTLNSTSRSSKGLRIVFLISFSRPLMSRSTASMMGHLY